MDKTLYQFQTYILKVITALYCLLDTVSCHLRSSTSQKKKKKKKFNFSNIGKTLETLKIQAVIFNTFHVKMEEPS